jgi:hypothetical protein
MYRAVDWSAQGSACTPRDASNPIAATRRLRRGRRSKRWASGCRLNDSRYPSSDGAAMPPSPPLSPPTPLALSLSHDSRRSDIAF